MVVFQTSVAGIIAAEGWNGKGGRGVAPKAEIFGINVIAEDVDGEQFSQDKFVENKDLFALGLKNENGELLFEASENIAVFNRSYGDNPLRFLGYNDIAKFEDYTGTYMYHCHLLEHEDNGMMGQFEIVS